MKIQVEITQKTIDGANHHACCSCPTAKSINRNLNETQTYPRIEEASVHLRDGHCTIAKEEGGDKIRSVYKFKLPEVAQKFVRAWDARSKVTPCSFELDLVEYGPRVNPRCTL